MYFIAILIIFDRFICISYNFFTSVCEILNKVCPAFLGIIWNPLNTELAHKRTVKGSENGEGLTVPSGEWQYQMQTQ